MRAEERISPHLIEQMRTAIVEAHGGEVLFVGTTDEDGTVIDADIVARGSANAVPAPPAHMARGSVVIHNHPTGVLKPSDADVAIAADLCSAGIGSYLVDNAVQQLAVICEPIPASESTPLDADELAARIDSGGALSRAKPGFEPRPAQIDLLRSVAEAFNEDQLVAAEAGTGVGKSYAYLIPAVEWAHLNGERVVVSTATINLQQQLIEKDIPTVLRLTAGEVKAVLVKGRGNYLCKKRLIEAREEDALFSEDDDDLAHIAEWAHATPDGSRSDLPFVTDGRTWSRVNAEAESCTAVKCPHYENCFLFRARRQAADARLLVVNHHLLFSDLAIRASGFGYDATAVLPPFQRLIIDEAHNVESSATSFFSETFSRSGVRKLVGRLLRTRRGRTFGLLIRLESLLETDERETVRAACTAVDEAADALETWAIAATDRLSRRIMRVPQEIDPQAAGELARAIAELRTRVAVLVTGIAPILDRAEVSDDPPVQDLRLVSRRLENLNSLCRAFESCDDHPDRVFFVETRRWSDGSVHAWFVSSPLDVGDVLSEAVYQVFPTVVFTSATLTVGGEFTFWANRIGLDRGGRDLITRRLPSPFDYQRNVLLAVPEDAPPPTDPGYQSYLNKLLVDVLEVSEGGALVLFTSYQMLQASHQAVRESLAAFGVTVLRQGDDDRARLLTRFTDDLSSVLFATESFWQGVDAPGATLRLLVICRLPFRVPNEPVVAARMEAIEAAGGNAFAELSLPDAVMRFSQGFGRLIRTSNDYGVVLVPDVRLIAKPYGRSFLSSLPDTRRAIGPTTAVIETIEQFLYESR